VKKLSEHSMLDNELYKLESNIIWKKANSNELKQKLITDINKQSYRAKFNKFIGHSVRIGASAAVLFIGFIFLSQNVKNVPFTNGGNNKEINQPELPIKNKDEKIVFTAEEQNLIESSNVSKILTLTEEATISLDSIDSISTHMGKPEIIVKKEKEKVLVNLLYPEDNGLSIQSNINEQGSESLAYDSLIKEYPKYLPVTSIHNHSAILIESENQKSYLFIVTEKFIYEISGSSKNIAEIIKIAKLINIKNSREVDKPAIVKENSEIVIVNSLYETSEEGLSIILENAPFKVVVPTANNLTLTHAYMNKVRENTNERNVDISYQTPRGEVHIWQSNLNTEASEKDPFNVSGYEKKTVKIGAQNWYFSTHKDDKELLIFTTKLDDKVVSVDGKVPYAVLVEIILSLK
jgi:hypothetical protein